MTYSPIIRLWKLAITWDAWDKDNGDSRRVFFINRPFWMADHTIAFCFRFFGKGLNIWFAWPNYGLELEELQEREKAKYGPKGWLYQKTKGEKQSYWVDDNA